MPETMRLVRTGTIGGATGTFTETINVSGDSIERASPSIPAAKTGTLTVRTDADTGSLTMAASHGITTGQKLDVFWATGSRRNMTVGTVATNVVPIDGGSGDDLPDAATSITAMVPVEVVMSLDGDTALGIMVSSPVKGYIVFVDDAPADISAATYEIEADDQGKCWVDGNGVTNPLAGATVTKVKFSHKDSTAAQTMKAAVVLD